MDSLVDYIRSNNQSDGINRSNVDNKDEVLTNMSKLIFAARYNLSLLNRETLDEAINNAEIDKEEAIESIKVIKKINNQIEKI